MSGAEEALEAAVLAALAADATVAARLSEPLRVLAKESERPAYPFLEVARHECPNAGSAGAEASEHCIDLAVMAREYGGSEAREIIAAMRAALAGASLAMAAWRCVLAVPAFADTARRQPGLWRGLLRLKAIVEPA